MLTTSDSNSGGSFIHEDESLERWYSELKRKGEVDANSWLVNMMTLDRQYGKTPASIAHMTSEQAYNFVLEIVRSMKNEEKSFVQVESMIKCINDWLEFNQKTMKPNIEPLKTIMSSIDVQSKNPFLQGDEPARMQQELSLEYKKLFAELKKKSDLLLEAHSFDFIRKMRDLERNLIQFDPSSDIILSSIDKRVNEGVQMDLGAYYLAAYSTTGDINKALTVYRLTNSLMRYIGLMDIFYETGDQDILQRAERLLEEVTARSHIYLRYSIKFSIERIWPFWKFENMIKQRLFEGGSFSDKELRYFILFKSSDTPFLYCSILDSYLDSFNPNVAVFFHYNQALIDILDDYFDFEEDFRNRMPNIFLMASSGDHAPPRFEVNSEEIKGILTRSEVKAKIAFLVNWLNKRLDEIILPSQYEFLRYITTDHVRKLECIIR